jgi:hypothetical protein
MNSHPTPNYVCDYECGNVGLFRVFRDDPAQDRWLIAKIPKGWGQARSSRTALPDVDGQVELPASLIPEIKTKAEALRYFKSSFVATMNPDQSNYVNQQPN